MEEIVGATPFFIIAERYSTNLKTRLERAQPALRSSPPPSSVSCMGELRFHRRWWEVRTFLWRDVKTWSELQEHSWNSDAHCYWRTISTLEACPTRWTTHSPFCLWERISWLEFLSLVQGQWRDRSVSLLSDGWSYSYLLSSTHSSAQFSPSTFSTCLSTV